MRFIHCADIHLDSPFLGLSARPDAPRDTLFGATRQAFTALVDRALREAVDFVVIAGDLYDGTWKDYTTGLFFVKEMGRLARAGIPVYLLHGNHDAESQLTRKLRLPENVHVFSAHRPETFRVEGRPVALHGQSFATRSVTQNLAAAYPLPEPGVFNVGVLHTAADGRGGTDHDPYAPCTLAELVTRDYQYWALGHVHANQVLYENPHVVFPGNLQGRHARETGPKGFALVTVSDNRVTRIDHVPVDVVRWARVTVDLSGAVDFDAAFDRIRPAIGEAIDDARGRLPALRIVLTGRTAAHWRLKSEADGLVPQCQADALLFSDCAWIEKVLVETRSPRDEDVGGVGADSVGVLLGAIAEAVEDREALSGLEAELSGFLTRLPPELRRRLGRDLAEIDPEMMAGLLDDARLLIHHRVLEEETEA